MSIKLSNTDEKDYDGFALKVCYVNLYHSYMFTHCYYGKIQQKIYFDKYNNSIQNKELFILFGKYEFGYLKESNL